jgi:hypothetical protein
MNMRDYPRLHLYTNSSKGAVILLHQNTKIRSTNAEYVWYIITEENWVETHGGCVL